MSKRIPLIVAAFFAVAIFGELSFGQLRLPFRGNPNSGTGSTSCSKRHQSKAE